MDLVKIGFQINANGLKDANKELDNLLAKADKLNALGNGGGQGGGSGGSGGYSQSFGSNGWTKLPNGLIIQWGICTEGTNTLPITFPSAFCSVNATFTRTMIFEAGNTVTIINSSSFKYQIGGANNGKAYYIAVGY